jgi:hypothetical protein
LHFVFHLRYWRRFRGFFKEVMMFRSHGSRMVVVLALALSAVAAAACSGSQTALTTPTSAAGNSPAASPASGAVSGATISGTVVGVTTASAVKTMGVTMSVGVAGSNASATVDGSGRFTLTNVPAGHVELHFTGTGVDAVLGLDGVAEHSTVVITVRINGHDAHLEDEHRDNGDDNQNQAELNGIVSIGSLTGSCAAHNLSFMVGSTRVTTNASTLFRSATCDAIKGGSQVEIKGTRQADGSVLAASVDGEGENEDENDELKGTIAAGSITGSCAANTLAFKVGTTPVKTNAATQFKDTSCTALAAGSSVEVKGTRQADGSFLATRIELKK